MQPFAITNPNDIQNFLDNMKPKKGRRVIWNSYSLGTYVKAKHGPIGSPKHSKVS